MEPHLNLSFHPLYQISLIQDDTMDYHDTTGYQTKTFDDDADIPKGFTLIEGHGKHPVLVPTFMVPTTMMAMKAEEIRSELNVDDIDPGVSDLKREYDN